jgi:hypothetical protein
MLTMAKMSNLAAPIPVVQRALVSLQFIRWFPAKDPTIREMNVEGLTIELASRVATTVSSYKNGGAPSFDCLERVPYYVIVCSVLVVRTRLR